MAPRVRSELAVARWFGDAIDRAARRLGAGEDHRAALAVAQAVGVAGFLERAGLSRFARSPNDAVVNRLRDTILLEAAAELSAALRAGGVHHAFIKGGGLLGLVYEPGDREQVDLDVLVPPADMRRTLRILLELGYGVPADARYDAPPSMRRGRTLVRPGRSELEHVSVDVNWAVAPVNRLLTYPDCAALTPLWDRVEGAAVPVPSAGHHLALIVHHLVYHDLLHARGLLDAALLAIRLVEQDEPTLADMTRRLRVRRAVRAVRETVDRGLGNGRHAGRHGWRDRRLLAELEPGALVAWAVSAPAQVHREITISRIRKRMLLVDRAADVVTLGRDLLVPPAAYRRWRWPTARSGLGGWFLHVRRMVGKAIGTAAPRSGMQDRAGPASGSA